MFGDAFHWESDALHYRFVAMDDVKLIVMCQTVGHKEMRDALAPIGAPYCCSDHTFL